MKNKIIKNDIFIKFDKYLKKINFVDYYLTKNILKLTNDDIFFNFINKNNFLLGLTNSLNENCLQILLKNKKYSFLINLIENDYNLLNVKDHNETCFFTCLIDHNYFYDFISHVILNYNKEFVIKLLTTKNINGLTFVESIIELLNLCNCEEDLQLQDYQKIIVIFNNIQKLNSENKILLITNLSKNINNKCILINIFSKIKNNFIIYPDQNMLNSVDYLLLKDYYTCLILLINKSKEIKFCIFDNSFILEFIENNLNENIVNVISQLINKSNINELKNKNGDSILDILKYFDKKNILNLKKCIEILNSKNEKNIKNIKNIKNNVNNRKIKIEKKQFENIINKIKTILINDESVYFSSVPLSNMFYTLYIINKYDNVCIPYKIKNKNEKEKEKLLLQIADIDYMILNYLDFYKKYFDCFMTHLIIWKDKWNYFIDKENLINFINECKKRFILIKITIVLVKDSNVKHANYLIVDKENKTIERFEPYGNIDIKNSNELNKMIETELCKSLNYTFEFLQLYPGLQIKSDESNLLIKNINDPTGYCLAWCYLYIEIKLLNNLKINTRELIELYIENYFKKDFKEITDNKNKYLYFIRYYSNKLDEEKNKIMKIIGMNDIYKKNIDDLEMKKISKFINNKLLNKIK